MTRTISIASLSILVSLAVFGIAVAWKEGHFSAPVVGMTYENCGSYRSIIFRNDSRVELVSRLSHEIYDYEIIDADQVAIKTPIATFLTPFDPEGSITWSTPMSKTKQVCYPAAQRDKFATNFLLTTFHTLQDTFNSLRSKPINPNLRASWESVYQAAYGKSPIYTRGTRAHDPDIKNSYDSADLYGWTGKKAAGVAEGMSLYADLDDLRGRSQEIAEAGCLWLQSSGRKRIQIGASGDGRRGGERGGMTITQETCEIGPTWQYISPER